MINAFGPDQDILEAVLEQVKWFLVLAAASLVSGYAQVRAAVSLSSLSPSPFVLLSAGHVLGCGPCAGVCVFYDLHMLP